ncbi:hypothetical protein KEM55_000678 [Ascosphaera atra]|nr:hypothetical protein KEM55_000678 [Ascosphaera atra]
MGRGNVVNEKVFYQGKTDDFVVFVEDAEIVRRWKADKSIPLVDVVRSMQVFTTHKQGAQGMHDTASKASLSGEFGTDKAEDAIVKILEEGHIQDTENVGRVGVRNETQSQKNAF